jgi:hypothetical protein
LEKSSQKAIGSAAARSRQNKPDGRSVSSGKQNKTAIQGKLNIDHNTAKSVLLTIGWY